MDYENIMMIISALYCKSRNLVFSNEIDFKWELSPDIIDILQTNITCHYLRLNTYENITLYGYPVDIDYSKTSYIKLWSEVK